MTDTPVNFPSYPPKLGPRFIPHAQAKPMVKMMARAFAGKLKKGLFHTHVKRKKARIV
jgi:hypothetical protein